MLEKLGALPMRMQVLLLVVVAGGLIALIEYVDTDIIGFPGFNPIKAGKVEQAQLVQKHSGLEIEVRQLTAFQAQFAEKQKQLANTQAELERTRVQVPTEKRTDDFLRVLESSSLFAQVSLRGLTAQPVVYKEFYADLPFQVNFDGPFYNLKDYFLRLSRDDRIINIGSLNLEALGDTATEFEYVVGSSVKGTCTVTTYYIPSEEELAASAPPQQPGRRPGGAPPRPGGAAPPQPGAAPPR